MIQLCSTKSHDVKISPSIIAGTVEAATHGAGYTTASHTYFHGAAQIDVPSVSVLVTKVGSFRYGA